MKLSRLTGGGIELTVDLSTAPIIDAHCHGLELDDVLAAAPAWADRITLLGMCMASSESADPALKAQVSRLTGSTVFAQAARRWLAHWLDVEEGDVENERRRRLNSDPYAYLNSLTTDENITDLLVDDGWPHPPVDSTEFGKLMGVKAHRVTRIEPIIDRLLPTVSDSDELIEAFSAELDRCGTDSTCVAYKSVIAYRSGLDISDPNDEEVRSAFRAWRDGGFGSGRHAKPVRDRLLHLTCRLATSQDRPVHIHSGAGDPDVVLEYARPTGLAPLIASHPTTAFVLIHSGFPWIEEAAYLAGLYANAHVETSLFSPWTTLDLSRALTTLLGMTPAAKIMYGSDEASEPEVLWLSARIFRRSLTQVLQKAVDDDFLSNRQAQETGEAILSSNARRLHAIAP